VRGNHQVMRRPMPFGPVSKAGPTRRRFLAAGLVAATAMPLPGAAEVSQQVVDGAAAFIADLADRAIAVLSLPDDTLEQREDAFRQLLRQYFALDFIGRFVLAANWRRATPEQQQEYLALFSEW